MKSKALEALLRHMLSKSKHYIGAKHKSEEKLIKSRTKWISREKRREFDKEYKKLINKGYLLRLKKRTGKGSSWHISLNPRKLKDIYEILE